MADPGYTDSPVFVFMVEYARLTVSICGAVRQDGPSPALQASVAGLKAHFSGSLRKPSLTPSRASHAACTALASSVIFSGESLRTGVPIDSTCRCTCDALRRSML